MADAPRITLHDDLATNIEKITKTFSTIDSNIEYYDKIVSPEYWQDINAHAHKLEELLGYIVNGFGSKNGHT